MPNGPDAATGRPSEDPQPPRSTWVLITIDDISASEEREFLEAVIVDRFNETVAAVADSLVWPLTYDHARTQIHDELIRSGHLTGRNSDYLPLATVEPGFDGEPVAEYWVAIDEVLIRLGSWAALLVAERTPRSELVVSLGGTLDPVIKRVVVAELGDHEAA